MMQEPIRQAEKRGTTYVTASWPSNDSQCAPFTMGRSWFPDDAVARIYKPSRSVMTSGGARTRGWRLTFERRTAPGIEPLMGWTGGDDTLTQVELNFPTREAAIRYAERQGLRYTVQSAGGAADRKRCATPSARAFSDATLKKLGLKGLQDSYGHAIDGAANGNNPSGSEAWGSPLDVVHDRTLSLDAKRLILINWAWSKYLIDHATEEVEQALLALEREVAEDRDVSTARKTA
ncbi:ETC complex I subunit [Nitrospirillum sp. BR 11163]|uniref:ETC complex I subunit n=1 Tax=Nitrospirillum sp. BR 11163 TaxID=3104323 RepID=UPI002B002753|nr:ETC complex I subunit [Nitrospirillum sp. BR 11163]MEA1672853.1 ETC complex I subunit [Nitrospirillum sp. BR 11163]